MVTVKLFVCFSFMFIVCVCWVTFILKSSFALILLFCFCVLIMLIWIMLDKSQYAFFSGVLMFSLHIINNRQSPVPYPYLTRTV